MKHLAIRAAIITVAVLVTASAAHAQVIPLWSQGKVAFGVYAPNENAPPPGAMPRFRPPRILGPNP